MRIVDQGDRVKIDVGIGIHRLSRDSAVGKTAFGYMAKADNGLSTNVIHFKSARDYNSLSEYSGMRKDNTIFLFDRFDLFQTDELWRYLAENSDRCILVDCKYSWKYYAHSVPVRVILSERGIYITDDNVS